MSGEVMDAHRFQAARCAELKRPILNVACKEDPAKLGERYGAVNLDITTFDEFTSKRLTEIRNFVEGDARKLTEMFEPQSFETIVLGEFLEHCVEHVAQHVLEEIKTVLTDDGRLVVTFPLDDRKPERQHSKAKLKVVVPGATGHDITTWHQTVWHEEKFDTLLSVVGFTIVEKTVLKYSFVNKDPGGYGVVLKKEQ